MAFTALRVFCLTAALGVKNEKGKRNMNKLFQKGFFFDADPGGNSDPPAPVTDPAKPEPAKSTEPEPKTVPYERFKEVNDKANDLEKRLKAIEDEKKAADEKALKDKEDFKTLYEQEQEKNKAKESELLRLRVAQKKGLPADLVDRLKGETEQELEADADKLLTFVDTSKSPGNPPRKLGGGPTTLNIADMTPEDIRKNADRLMEQAAAEFGK